MPKYIASNANTIHDWFNKKGWTPLHSAARFNPNPEILLTLIDAGADMNAMTESGKTFIFWMEKNSRLKKTVGYLKLLNMYSQNN